MTKLDKITPTGYDGRYKVVINVEGDWVAMALMSEEAICKLADLMDKLSDEDALEDNALAKAGILTKKTE